MRRIFREYVEGRGVSEIAAGLQADGIPNTKGTEKWYAKSVSDILHNEKYVGDMIFAKLEYNKDRAIATLHTFSMMGILGTDLDAVDGKTITYQFRVTPAEHPECFEKAA